MANSAFTPYHHYKERSYEDLKVEIFSRLVAKSQYNQNLNILDLFNNVLIETYKTTTPSYNQLLHLLNSIKN